MPKNPHPDDLMIELLDLILQELKQLRAQPRNEVHYHYTYPNAYPYTTYTPYQVTTTASPNFTTYWQGGQGPADGGVSTNISVSPSSGGSSGAVVTPEKLEEVLAEREEELLSLIKQRRGIA